MGHEQRADIERRLKEHEPVTQDELTALQEDWCVEVNAAVYKAALLFERAEGLGLIWGNGHHIAQGVGMYAENKLRERFRNAAGQATGVGPRVTA